MHWYTKTNPKTQAILEVIHPKTQAILQVIHRVAEP